MNADEQRARELLAAEYERDGQTLVASHIRNGSYEYIRAIRAITAALAQQVPADLEWAEPFVTFENGRMELDVKRWLATDAGREQVRKACATQ